MAGTSVTVTEGKFHYSALKRKKKNTHTFVRRVRMRLQNLLSERQGNRQESAASQLPALNNI